MVKKDYDDFYPMYNNNWYQCKRHSSLSVMTWNLYLGADFTPVILAPIEKIPEVVTQVYTDFLSTNFIVRAKAIAKKIDEYKPDIIGFEEVPIWEFIPPNSNKLTYDYIQILLHELRKIGLHYKVVQIGSNFSQQFPSSTGANIGFTDRISILVNEESNINILYSESGHYKTNIEYDFHGTKLVSLRGWAYMDVCYKGNKFRVIDTHLEAYSEEVNTAQANELINRPANTSLPVILIGDFNSDPTGQGYKNLIDANFRDTWLIGGSGDGLTCCQDGNLLNVYSNLIKRIDFILIKNDLNWSVVESKVVGNLPEDKSSLLQWPSDHASVITIFNLPSYHNW